MSSARMRVIRFAHKRASYLVSPHSRECGMSSARMRVIRFAHKRASYSVNDLPFMSVPVNLSLML